MRVKQRREGQNTGLRAKAARHVEDAPCEQRDEGNHELTNRRGVTFCRYCRSTWATLDGLLNGFTRGEVA